MQNIYLISESICYCSTRFLKVLAILFGQAYKESFVSAKYCEDFPSIKWKSGQTVHVNMTPQVQRDYEERMLIVLNAVQQR